SSQVFLAVFSASNFVNLEPAAQKRLLAQVLADEGIAVPAELQDTLGSEPLTIAQLDQAYKNAYDGRTVLNRELKALKAIEAPAIMEPPNLDDIKKRLAAITRERDAAVAERARLLSSGANHSA